MSKTTKDFSIDYEIANQVGSYLCPEYSIYKIKYLYSESFLHEYSDRDGPTGDFYPILKQEIVEKILEIIPDDKLDKNSKEYSINVLKKKQEWHYYPSQFIKDIFTQCKIPESLFLNWINKDNNLFKQKSYSYTYLSHKKIYSSNKISNQLKENNSITKNLSGSILENNNLISENKSFFKIKYVMYTKIDKKFYENGKGNCIFEIYHKDIFFKSDIKKNHPNLTYMERFSFIKNLQNDKVVESNPISYFLESIQKSKISYNFLSLGLKYDNDDMSYQTEDKSVKIFYLERIV